MGFTSLPLATTGNRHRASAVAGRCRRGLGMSSKPVYPSDLNRLSRVLDKVSRQLELKKGSIETDQLAAQIFALMDTIADEDALVRFLVAERRRSGFKVLE